MTRQQAGVRGLVLALLLLAYGGGASLLPGHLHVPLNLALAAALVLWAIRRAEFNWADLGLGREHT